jgi:hypothetical protein
MGQNNSDARLLHRVEMIVGAAALSTVELLLGQRLDLVTPEIGSRPHHPNTSVH